MAVDREDEKCRHYRPHQVAHDHDALAVHAVEQHARQRSGHHRRDGPRQHDAGDHHARTGPFKRQAEDGDVVEVVADLADHLPHPGVAVVSIVPEKPQERGPAGGQYLAAGMAHGSFFASSQRLSISASVA